MNLRVFHNHAKGVFWRVVEKSWNSSYREPLFDQRECIWWTTFTDSCESLEDGKAVFEKQQNEDNCQKPNFDEATGWLVTKRRRVECGIAEDKTTPTGIWPEISERKSNPA